MLVLADNPEIHFSLVLVYLRKNPGAARRKLYPQNFSGAARTKTEQKCFDQKKVPQTRDHVNQIKVQKIDTFFAPM